MRVTPTTATRQQRRMLKAENKLWPMVLKQIPRTDWPQGYHPPGIKEVWRSRDFLVQVYDDPRSGTERMSVCRTFVFDGNWLAEVSWDDLQRLKRECGRGNLDAVEIFPADADVVNVANMRHLWFVEAAQIPFKWR